MRLIDADAILKADENSDKALVLGSGKSLEIAYALLKKKVEDAPTVDAAPVVHGRWDDSGRYTFPGGGTAVRCTECGCALTVSEYHLNNWNYCPVCGAKMDGGADHEAD